MRLEGHQGKIKRVRKITFLLTSVFVPQALRSKYYYGVIMADVGIFIKSSLSMFVLLTASCAATKTASLDPTACIREALVALKTSNAVTQAAVECGVMPPDLTGDPGLQRRAQYEGLPYIVQRVGPGGRTSRSECKIPGSMTSPSPAPVNYSCSTTATK